MSAGKTVQYSGVQWSTGNTVQLWEFSAVQWNTGNTVKYCELSAVQYSTVEYWE